MTQKYYIDDATPDPGGGGGGGGNPPTTPKGYAVTTPQQRSDWNSFLDYAGKQPGANLSDATQQAALLAQYKKANPNFSITPEQIPNIQYEAYQLRKGDKFGNLGTKELGYIRSGLPANFLNTDTSNIGKLYYPKEGSFDTDIENYYNSKFNPAAAPKGALPVGIPAPVATAGQDNAGVAFGRAPTAPPPTSLPTGAIPRPDYSDPDARIKFGNSFVSKYKINDWDKDIPLRVDEVPVKGTTTAKNMAINASKLTGIDPALLYTSSMVEGMTGMFKDKEGKAGRWLAPGVDPKSEFSVSGSASFGNDQFVDRVDDYIKKGYLPADFKSRFVPYVPPKEGTTKNSALFRTADDAMLAKAARLREDFDVVDDYSKQNKLQISPAAREFFSLVSYNAGPKTAKEMIQDYMKNGYLKNDAFLKARPVSGEGLKDTSYKDVYQNVITRLRARDGLKKEQLFQ